MSPNGDIVQATCGPQLLASGSPTTSCQSSSTRTRSWACKPPVERKAAKQNPKLARYFRQELVARRTTFMGELLRMGRGPASPRCAGDVALYDQERGAS